MRDVNARYAVGRPLHKITVSIGVALSSESITMFNDVMRAADKMLLLVKERGRNRVAIWGKVVDGTDK